MASAQIDTVVVDFDNSGYIFRSVGNTIAFPGYMAIYGDMENGDNADIESGIFEKNKLPNLSIEEKLIKKSIEPQQHFTEPPRRR